MIPSNPHRPWRQAVPFQPSRGDRWATIGSFVAAFLNDRPLAGRRMALAGHPLDSRAAMTMTVDRTRCNVMLCVGKPKGLVRAQVYLAPADATPSIREVPMCQGCADEVGERFKKGDRLHLTPGGALYVGDLQRLMPRRTPVTLLPISLERCAYCEQPSEELVTYVDGVSICLSCRAKEQARVAASDAAYREAYGPDFDKLAAYQAEGR